VKIRFTGLNPIPDADVVRNVAHAKSLGFPKSGTAGAEHLAIVGGGPSIAGRLEDIRAWDGDVWAINGAFRYLRERDVDATFFSIDPTDLILPDLEGATRAVLGMTCHPDVFAAFDLATVCAIETRHAGVTTSTAGIHAAQV
jgi:hypothetical protein